MTFYKIQRKESKNFTPEPYWATEGFSSEIW